MSDPSSIYCHLPFCVKKCGYCDFFSRTDLSLIPSYVESLQQEIEIRSVSAKEITTLYFGGGTPSLLSPGQIEQVFDTIDQSFKVSSQCEITLEVNPGTVDIHYLRDLKKAGVNRLSIGVQSFDDEKLRVLGRIHTADQAMKTINNAQKAGFENISLDLMYGLFFETEKGWQKDLETVVKTEVPHLSCYMLTLEPSTPLFARYDRGEATVLDNETMSAFFVMTSEWLTGAGYEHYEISSFARGNKNRSKHNSSYWAMRPYYGFGAAAHSFDGKVRSWNHRDIDLYITDIRSGKLPVAESETLTTEQEMLEMILLGLRMAEGIDMEKFETQFKVSFEKKFGRILSDLINLKFAVLTGQRFSLTLQGRTRLNHILEILAGEILED